MIKRLLKNIFQKISNLFSATGKLIKRGTKLLTYKISRVVTGTILVLGGLVGIYSASGNFDFSRIWIAGMTMIIGLPIGAIIFGQAFTASVWFSICIIVLMLSNLYSAWEIISILKNGGLDYHMERSIVSSVSSITPGKEEFQELKRDKSETQAKMEETFSRRGMEDNLLPSL